MNKRDVINQVKKFNNRFNQFLRTLKDNYYDNKLKHVKETLKLNVSKTNIFNEQVSYVFRGILQNLKNNPLLTLLTTISITIPLILPSVCYIIHKNINQVMLRYYPSPQITVYLDKALDDYAGMQIVKQLQSENNIEKVSYFSREKALGKFRNWSKLINTLVILEDNPLPAVLVVIPKLNFQGTNSLNMLRNHIIHINGVNKVQIDNSWFIRLTLIPKLAWYFSFTISITTMVVLFLVISNSVRINILTSSDTIKVQKLIGATEDFIFRPFHYSGMLLGFFGASLSLILSKILVMQILLIVIKVEHIFGIKFNINGLDFNECILLILICSIIGWLAARMATIQHLRYFTLN